MDTMDPRSEILMDTILYHQVIYIQVILADGNKKLSYGHAIYTINLIILAAMSELMT